LPTDELARAVLEKLAVEAVTVTARRATPIAGVLKLAGVRITRTREDADATRAGRQRPIQDVNRR
jgi:hypothetical protein